MKKMVSWILSLAMISLALFGCVASAGATEAADELPVIRVGVIPGASSSLPFFYVHEQGWDAENGFTLEILTFNSGAPANEAMLAGEIDCSVIGGAATVAALANQGAKMIMEICNDAVGVSVLAQPDAAAASVVGAIAEYPNVRGDADSVKGMTILFPPGTMQQYMLLKYLEVINLDQGETNAVAMDAGNINSAMLIQQGDLCATASAGAFKLLSEGMVSLCSMEDLGIGATAQLVVSASAYTDLHDEFVELVKLVAEAGEMLNEDDTLYTSLYMEKRKLMGSEITQEVADFFASQDVFYSAEDISQRILGNDFIETFVDFYVSTDQLEASQAEGLSDNIKDDILREAGLIS